MSLHPSLSDPLTSDRTGPDGGFVITDFGTFARAVEYIDAGELDPEFAQACGAPADANPRGFVWFDCSVDLERRPLRDYRRAIDACGWLSRAADLTRPRIIEALLLYGFGDTDSLGEWAPTLESRLTLAYGAPCAHCGATDTRKVAFVGRGPQCASCEYRDWRATIGALAAPQG